MLRTVPSTSPVVRADGQEQGERGPQCDEPSAWRAEVNPHQGEGERAHLAQQRRPLSYECNHVDFAGGCRCRRFIPI